MLTSRKSLGRRSLRGLLATRHGAILLALGCGLVAVGVIVFAMSKYRHSVTSGTEQATVFVSTAEIPKGASANAIAAQRLYKVVPVLAGQVAPDAIANAGSLVGKVAANTILPGQQLTAADFVAPTGESALLAPADRIVAVTLDAAHAVAGVLVPGARVDVYADVSNVVTLLVPNALVLKAPTAPAGGAAGTVLLDVAWQLSPRVMWAFDNGKVWLELRAPNATGPTPTTTGVRQVLSDPPATAAGSAASLTTFSKP